MCKFLGTRALYRGGQAGRRPALGAGVASAPGTPRRGQGRRGGTQFLADFLRAPAPSPRAGASSLGASVSSVKSEVQCSPRRREDPWGARRRQTSELPAPAHSTPS